MKIELTRDELDYLKDLLWDDLDDDMPPEYWRLRNKVELALYG